MTVLTKWYGHQVLQASSSRKEVSLLGCGLKCLSRMSSNWQVSMWRVRLVNTGKTWYKRNRHSLKIWANKWSNDNRDIWSELNTATRNGCAGCVIRILTSSSLYYQLLKGCDSGSLCFGSLGYLSKMRSPWCCLKSVSWSHLRLGTEAWYEYSLQLIPRCAEGWAHRRAKLEDCMKESGDVIPLLQSHTADLRCQSPTWKLCTLELGPFPFSLSSLWTTVWQYKEHGVSIAVRLEKQVLKYYY